MPAKFTGTLATVFLSLFLLTHSGKAQDNNVFVERAYWTSNPSIKQVKADIKKGNDPAAFNRHKFDAVTWAIIEQASNKTVWYLLKQDGNGVNKRSHDGRTPIFWAAYKGNLELMKELIAQGAATDLIDDHGYSLLTFAATTGQTNTELYDLCIQHGSDMGKENSKSGASSLLLMMPYINTNELLEYFTQKGLSIKDLDKKGNNAFVYASTTGNTFMMEYLLKRGMDPKANNSAAMLFAARGTRSKKNDLATFSYLMDLGVSPGAVDEENRSALHYLAGYGNNQEVFDFFLDYGISSNQADEKGNTAFHSVVSRNKAEIVQFFIDSKADVLVANEKGENAIHLAAKRGNIEILKMLLAEGRGINSRTKDGLTPLHLAAMTSKDDAVLKCLLDHGADKSLKTEFEESALDLALENELLKQNNVSTDFLK
ncbi:ankyrin repeat domain-containing protein [bacterium SCSIO 12741]|nr:ankyrin repeat domain-containing protein [bacterium SCSIO 12741]